MKRWQYTCSSETIWGNFDNGIVLADTMESARECARTRIEKSLEDINSMLHGVYTIKMNLDNINLTKID
jgi:hypothetical protein